MSDQQYVPFPVELLPASIGLYAESAARAIHCDPSFIALPLLSALGAAIGNSMVIRLKAGARPYDEPPILWTAPVGYSGTAKTPAIKAALWPVERREKQAMKEAAGLQAEYASEELNYQAALMAWKRTGRKAGEPEPDKPTPPVCQRFSVSDATVEALADRLADNPRGLLLVRDELSGWLRSFDQYKAGKGGDCAHWLSMFDASPLRIDRKTGDRKTIYIPRAAVSICGGIQPDVLRAALGQEHFADGLAARFLLAMPPRHPARWTEAEIPMALGDALVNVFERLWSLEPIIDDDGHICPQHLSLTPDAKIAWVTFFNRHGEEQLELDGDLSAAWSKLRGSAARLALVIYLANWAAGDEAEPSRIDETSIEAGIGLADWFGKEAQRVYSLLSESDDDKDERELIAWIERKGGRATVRDMSRGMRQFRGSAPELEKVLARIAKRKRGHWVNVNHGGGRGRPSQIFELLTNGDGDENSQFPAKTAIVSPSPPGKNGKPQPEATDDGEMEWTA